MDRQDFRFAYIDAFAGTGYRTSEGVDAAESPYLELTEPEGEEFVKGSAHVALEIEPRFTKYIFIEKDEGNLRELNTLPTEYPDLASDIVIEHGEANAYLNELCRNRNWDRNRAVMFLDPYGMQVRWETIEAIASTKAIDLWLLFPLGVAVNRLLRRDAEISEGNRHRLDEMFGEPDWYRAFYEERSEESLFGTESRTRKVSDFKSISGYFVRRLKTIFPGVAENPLALRNSRNNPLYLLCFASANPRGSKTAVKIAQEILSKP